MVMMAVFSGSSGDGRTFPPRPSPFGPASPDEDIRTQPSRDRLREGRPGWAGQQRSGECGGAQGRVRAWEGTGRPGGSPRRGIMASSLPLRSRGLRWHRGTGPVGISPISPDRRCCQGLSGLDGHRPPAMGGRPSRRRRGFGRPAARPPQSPSHSRRGIGDGIVVAFALPPPTPPHPACGEGGRGQVVARKGSQGGRGQRKGSSRWLTSTRRRVGGDVAAFVALRLKDAESARQDGVALGKGTWEGDVVDILDLFGWGWR